MNLSKEIKVTWEEKDRDKMSEVVKQQMDIILVELSKQESPLTTEAYKFNGGFPNMINVFNEAMDELNYSKAKYILELFIENYSLKKYEVVLQD